jgi:hypothetical protein
MDFKEITPIVLIPLYIMGVLVFCGFWLVAVPVYMLTLVAGAVHLEMKRISQNFKQFDDFLSKKLEEIWVGIV